MSNRLPGTSLKVQGMMQSLIAFCTESLCHVDCNVCCQIRPGFDVPH